MSNTPTGSGRLPANHSASLSGKPKAFSHVKNVSKGYNYASSGKREKEPLRHHAPKMKKDFGKAHEGPREKTGKPEKHFIHTPSGKVVVEVHAKHDQEIVLRNRKKDLQMKKWREAKQTTTKRFNARTMLPQHLRTKKTPQVFSAESRKAFLKKRLETKKERADNDQSR